MTNAPVGQSEKYNSQMILDFPKLTIKIKKKKTTQTDSPREKLHHI